MNNNNEKVSLKKIKAINLSYLLNLLKSNQVEQYQTEIKQVCDKLNKLYNEYTPIIDFYTASQAEIETLYLEVYAHGYNKINLVTEDLTKFLISAVGFDPIKYEVIGFQNNRVVEYFKGLAKGINNFWGEEKNLFYAKIPNFCQTINQIYIDIKDGKIKLPINEELIDYSISFGQAIAKDFDQEPLKSSIEGLLNSEVFGIPRFPTEEIKTKVKNFIIQDFIFKGVSLLSLKSDLRDFLPDATKISDFIIVIKSVNDLLFIQKMSIPHIKSLCQNIPELLEYHKKCSLFSLTNNLNSNYNLIKQDLEALTYDNFSFDYLKKNYDQLKISTAYAIFGDALYNYINQQIIDFIDRLPKKLKNHHANKINDIIKLINHESAEKPEIEKIYRKQEINVPTSFVNISENYFIKQYNEVNIGFWSNIYNKVFSSSSKNDKMAFMQTIANKIMTSEQSNNEKMKLLETTLKLSYQKVQDKKSSRLKSAIKHIANNCNIKEDLSNPILEQDIQNLNTLLGNNDTSLLIDNYPITKQESIQDNNFNQNFKPIRKIFNTHKYHVNENNNCQNFNFLFKNFYNNTKYVPYSEKNNELLEFLKQVFNEIEHKTSTINPDKETIRHYAVIVTREAGLNLSKNDKDSPIKTILDKLEKNPSLESSARKLGPSLFTQACSASLIQQCATLVAQGDQPHLASSNTATQRRNKL